MSHLIFAFYGFIVKKERLAQGILFPHVSLHLIPPLGFPQFLCLFPSFNYLLSEKQTNIHLQAIDRQTGKQADK